MKSKTSFFENLFGTWTPPTTKAAFPGDYFNGTLYKKNLLRWWPLWGLASLFGALIPLALLLSAMRGDLHITVRQFTQILYGLVGAGGVPCVLLCYCVLCAGAVWSWLYNPRSVGLYHTLPIRREGLFVTSFLSGLTMTAIPCAVTGFFTLLLSLAAGGFSGKAFLVTIGAVAGEGFFYFASATAVAFITGNAFSLPALYFIFHFLMPLLDTLGTVFASNLIFGLRSTAYTGVAPWLCPTAYLMENIHVRRLYDIPFPEDGLMQDYAAHWNGVELENGWIIGVYAVAGLVLTGIAWLLYRRRRSESAGDVIAVNWLKPVFQAGVTAVCALGGGQMLYLMLLNGFDDNAGKYALLPLILCMTFAGAIGYYAAAMFLAKSLRVFQKKTLPGLAAAAACCTVLCSLLYFDAFGAETRIPDMDRVQYVQLTLAGNNYFLYPGEDDALLEQVTDLHRQIVAERDYITGFDTRWYDGRGTNPWDYENLEISYRLKNGRTVVRSYPLYLTRERVSQPGTFDYMMDQLVNSTAMRQKRLHAGDARFQPTGGSLSVQRSNTHYDLSSRETAQLLDALSRDAAEGTWGTCDWFDSYRQDYAIELEMIFDAVDPDGNGQTNRSRDYTYISVRSGMDHTIGALKDMGYITDADLITYDEYDRLTEELYGTEFESEDEYASEYEMEYAQEYVFPETEAAVPSVPAEPDPTVPAEPVPADPAGETAAVNPDQMNPNSYTPPAVSGSSGSLDGWPGTNWDEDADPGTVDQYASAA